MTDWDKIKKVDSNQRARGGKDLSGLVPNKPQPDKEALDLDLLKKRIQYSMVCEKCHTPVMHDDMAYGGVQHCEKCNSSSFFREIPDIQVIDLLIAEVERLTTSVMAWKFRYEEVKFELKHLHSKGKKID